MRRLDTALDQMDQPLVDAADQTRVDESIHNQHAETVIIPAVRPQKPKGSPLRLVYHAGCGDILRTFHHWQQGEIDPNDLRPAYSGQFFDFCRDHGHQGWVISSHPAVGCIETPTLRVEHRPLRFPNSHGWKYHAVQLARSYRFMWDALRYGADAVIVSYGACHLFALGILPTFGIQVIPSLHNLMHAKNRPVSRMQRQILRFTGRFLRNKAFGTLSVSQEVTDQAREISGDEQLAVQSFLGIYSADYFQQIPLPDWSTRPFRVLYFGRLEADKGAFTLVELARRCKANQLPIVFDVCGDGSQRDTLLQQIQHLGLQKQLYLHGHCNQMQLQQHLSRSQVVIVPTTSHFPEGLNQSAIQGMLAGRPVLLSDNCPAKTYMPGAAWVVSADEVDAYQQALQRLMVDRKRYQLFQQASLEARKPFFDENRSWAASLGRILEPLQLRG